MAVRRHRPINPAWQSLRKNHLLTYPECRACGTEEDVVVHHLRYRGPRGTSERPGDLMTLCVTHHDDLHRRCPTGSLVGNTLAYVRAIARGEITA